MRLIIILFLLSLYSQNTHALSALTFNSIQGNAPYLLLSDGVTKITTLDRLLGFEMPKQDGSEGTELIDISMASNSLIAPSGMKYNDVVTLVAIDGRSHDVAGVIVGDDDGDAGVVTNTSVTGTMKATWYNNNLPVQSTDLGKTLSACGGPYTLKIEFPTDVSANTVYGAPNTNLYGSHSGITYTFVPSNKTLCYLKPASLTTYTGTVGADIKYADGYNPEIWLPNKGFTIDSGFPTTGFEQAIFSVIGSGEDQSQYRCRSTDDGGKIILSGSAGKALGDKCMIAYNVTTKAEFISGGTPTIKMEYKTEDNIWVDIGSYTIPEPAKWALVRNDLFYSDRSYLTKSTSFPVLDACRLVVDGNNTPKTTYAQVSDMTSEGKAWRQKYLYRRDEITNNSYADPSLYPEMNSGIVWNEGRFSRDLGSFMGEWGDFFTYIIAGLATNWFWTAELNSSEAPFGVEAPYGRTVGLRPDAIGANVLCRGE